MGTYVPADDIGYVNVRSGTFAAYGVVRGYGIVPPEAITLSQVVSVSPGQNLDVGFFASNWADSSYGAGQGNAPNLISILVNGTEILPSVSYFLFSNDKSWYEFEGSYNTGSATSIDVTFQFVASGTHNFPVSLDDFFVETTATPEPSSMLLLASGLVGFAGIIRRKLG